MLQRRGVTPGYAMAIITPGYVLVGLTPGYAMASLTPGCVMAGRRHLVIVSGGLLLHVQNYSLTYVRVCVCV